MLRLIFSRDLAPCSLLLAPCFRGRRGALYVLYVEYIDNRNELGYDRCLLHGTGGKPLIGGASVHVVRDTVQGPRW